MGIHESYSPNFTVITDGGAFGCCYSNAFKTVLRVFRKWRLPWIWILSHMDHDHFSIVESLIKTNILPKPSAIILPASYSLDVCKDTLIYYLALAEIIAYKLRIRPPRYIDIFEILSKCPNNIGVCSGTVLSAGNLEYLIIWPEYDYAANKCRELLDSLRLKIKKLCKDDPMCKKIAEEAIKKIRYKAGDLKIEVHRDYVDIPILGKAKNFHGLETPPYSMRTICLEDSSRETSIEILFREAARELNDPELYRLTRNVQNIHSIGYIARVRNPHSLIHIHISNLDLFNYCLGFYNFNRLLLLYLADLEGDELYVAIKNYIKYTHQGDRVLIEIAPHHGNS